MSRQRKEKFMIGGGEEDEKYHVDHELQYGTAGCPDLPYGEEGGGPAGGTEGLSPEAL